MDRDVARNPQCCRARERAPERLLPRRAARCSRHERNHRPMIQRTRWAGAPTSTRSNSTTTSSRRSSQVRPTPRDAPGRLPDLRAAGPWSRRVAPPPLLDGAHIRTHPSRLRRPPGRPPPSIPHPSPPPLLLVPPKTFLPEHLNRMAASSLPPSQLLDPTPQSLPSPPSSLLSLSRAGVLTGSPIQAETRKRVVGVAASNPSRR